MNRDELSRIFVELPSFIARWKSLEKGEWKNV